MRLWAGDRKEEDVNIGDGLRDNFSFIFLPSSVLWGMGMREGVDGTFFCRRTGLGGVEIVAVS